MTTETLVAKINSDDILAALRKHTVAYPITVANKMSFLRWSNNADFVAVTNSGQVYEYEIKTNRADFMRDKQKNRWMIYSTTNTMAKPNRFWFVTAPGVVGIQDIPQWAGWLEFMAGSLCKMKPAPILFKGQLELEVILRLAKAMKQRRATRVGQVDNHRN